jgi:hypothetical protein
MFATRSKFVGYFSGDCANNHAARLIAEAIVAEPHPSESCSPYA